MKYLDNPKVRHPIEEYIRRYVEDSADKEEAISDFIDVCIKIKRNI